MVLLCFVSTLLSLALARVQEVTVGCSLVWWGAVAEVAKFVVLSEEFLDRCTKEQIIMRLRFLIKGKRHCQKNFKGYFE